MGLGSTIAATIKGKIIITAIVSTAILGGTGAALAATPAGQHLVQLITVNSTQPVQHDNKSTVDSHTSDDKNGKEDTNSATPSNASDKKKECARLPEAQNLATKFALSTDEKGASVQAICSLHAGSYTGLTHTLGYGDIEDLLTYAKYLASKDTTNTDGKLADSNVTSYLDAALKNCGSSPIAQCVKTNVPNDQHGNNSDTNNSNNGNSNDNKGDNGNNHDNNAKPTSTPTPKH